MEESLQGINLIQVSNDDSGADHTGSCKSQHDDWFLLLVRYQALENLKILVSGFQRAVVSSVESVEVKVGGSVRKLLK